MTLLHDAHHRLTPNQAARLGKALEPLDLFWLEDVTPAENQEVLRQVRRHTTVPLAIGEVFNTVWEFQQLITEQLIDFVRAGVSHAGGISRLRRMPALAELCADQARPARALRRVAGQPSPPRCTSGWPRPTSRIQEYMGYDTAARGVPARLTFADGDLHPGDEPGLGVDVDEAAGCPLPVRAGLPAGRAPARRLDDGLVTR